MTLRAAEARALVVLAQAHGCELILGYPWHYTPQALRARELIRSGRLGAVQYVSCTVASSIARLPQGDDGSDKNSLVYPVHGPGAIYGDPALSGGGQGHLQITHLGQAANGSPAEDGWRTVELLDAAYRSAARQGQPVWVKDLYPDPGPI
jgi:predicted dehydrogenase